MIVITGATGALNGRTADRLVQRLPVSELAVVVRDPAKAQRFSDRGVAVRRGDYAERATLPDAFAGADQLLLVSSNDPSADAVALHAAAIDAAKGVGVGRILYTSHQGAAPGNPFSPGRTHYATEQLLADSGLAWTSLRNGFYTHSLMWLAGPWRDTGAIVVPADGPVSWTTREDAADAAAAILLADDSYDGPTTITANSAPTFADVAEIASELSGRRIAFEVVEPEGWVAKQIEGGQPEGMTRMLLGMYEAARDGYFAGVDPLLTSLLGREPTTVRDVLAQPPVG